MKKQNDSLIPPEEQYHDVSGWAGCFFGIVIFCAFVGALTIALAVGCGVNAIINLIIK